MRNFLNFSVVAITGLLFVAGRASAQAADPVAPQPPVGPAPTSPPEPERAATSQPPPADDAVVRRLPNWPLLITGAAVFGASYGASAIVAGTSDRASNNKLFLPGVGPWLALHDMDCDLVGCKSEGLYKGLLIADGAVQALGVVGIILGVVVPSPKQKPWYLIGDKNVLVAPQVGSSTVGVSASGNF